MKNIEELKNTLFNKFYYLLYNLYLMKRNALLNSTRNSIKSNELPDAVNGEYD